MKKHFLFVSLVILAFACKEESKPSAFVWTSYDESKELTENADHESVRMQFKRIQSELLDKNKLLKTISNQLDTFAEEDYQQLKPLIFEQDIVTIQSHIKSGKLTYELLTKWYLYRIAKHESDKNKMLNAVVAINPNAVSEAREKDSYKAANNHPIYGMPILLKDNINTDHMPTTAGTHLLKNNRPADAFIVEKIKENGGIILGKTNLSEWANFLFLGGPNGYSAVGGQTLNAYGRRVFDTGGSSSGSGAAMAANYAVAAVGTETSGSILSPSSSSSLVGLKPTVGLLSRSGIIPLSSTLDTPGPMTRNVIDNAILLSAMSGEDPKDAVTKNNPKNRSYLDNLKSGTLKGLRFGVITTLLNDTVYQQAISKLEAQGAIAVEFEPIEVNFDGFGDLLSADMRRDLPAYLNTYASDSISVRSMKEIVAYNKTDSVNRIPYGQARFLRATTVDLTDEELDQLRTRLHEEGKRFFDTPMNEHSLDAILSIDNQNAGYAAAAKYPCLTVPMGYRETGKPTGLTFIGKRYEEDQLLKMGYAFEQATKMRKVAKTYE
ncbi:amidase family protein [Aquimarina intermedia]|uniref:Amidase n=1 Tax=Aquimarina intermedia TaxID=350814 RepID=A0A5S5C2D8_9FLAO|nr:amidase family protein [Aquimarina intermedia]TYP72133.1 amidase [Aquimarina intermedia]